MAPTPRQVIDAVVRSVCGHEVAQLVRLTSGGVNETYRVELAAAGSVVVRIGRQPVPWFTDEAQVMAQARAVGVPTPDLLGVAHVDHAGELLARVHSVVPDRGIRHALQPPDERALARGAAFLRRELAARPAPSLALAHRDWLPKHLLIDDGTIVGVIDWERAGPASPAFDLARWEVSAGAGLHDRSDLLRRGYARVADPDAAADGWVPAFAVAWALEVLGWRNPAWPERMRRCVDVIARYAGA
jgi:aminoglycoside phosphotransferase (APT) family kinase protein